MQFRRASVVDVDAIVALVESAYRGVPSRDGWTTEADLLDGQRTDAAEVTGLLAAPATRIVLAENESGLLGSVLVFDEGDAAHVGMFAVRPRLQGRGVGAPCSSRRSGWRETSSADG